MHRMPLLCLGGLPWPGGVFSIFADKELLQKREALLAVPLLVPRNILFHFCLLGRCRVADGLLLVVRLVIAHPATEATCRVNAVEAVS